MKHRIVLFGRIPSKKNTRGLAPGGKVYIKPVDAADIASLMWQVREQWGESPPLMKPLITATVYVLNGRADLDNLYTCVQDVLVKGGVLRNDSIACLPGPITMTAIPGKDERVEIDLEVL